MYEYDSPTCVIRIFFFLGVSRNTLVSGYNHKILVSAHTPCRKYSEICPPSLKKLCGRRHHKWHKCVQRCWKLTDHFWQEKTLSGCILGKIWGYKLSKIPLYCWEVDLFKYANNSNIKNLTKRDTFRFNIKSSPLKLLCTLERLCEGTPLQPLRLDFFGIDFPSHAHNCHFYSHFLRAGQQGGKRRTEPMSALRSPTLPPKRHRTPPHFPLIHHQG